MPAYPPALADLQHPFMHQLHSSSSSSIVLWQLEAALNGSSALLQLGLALAA
jgi:hypothetical protein